MPRYKAIIEYYGPAYSGFQIQPDQHTVAGALLTALKKLSKEKIELNFAGRTDASVHAEGQVIDFFLTKEYPLYKITDGLNFYLKEAKEMIAVQETLLISDSFNSRYDAKEKTYEYHILNRRTPSPLYKNRAWQVKYELELEQMQLAANYLIGTHDFTSFRSVDCQANSAVRTINDLRLSKSSDLIKIRISGKSFLYNQVRIIAGTLFEIGRGKKQVIDMENILKAKDRKSAGQTAPAYGLYLLEVKY
ncbi:MAG: tRNA pseudouridine(38-40) synthase TruA [Alphaproteobacteria bacterium]|jgi:tRNA pseudouridine38-40 synthase|nr:tRNA pseudouridine(38-40) synthase TruA [Alphaproteobacteria bacterium]MBT5828125.1 tRNA pseudouridine(38-40) synthase TruA [Alphaproteobacteria bacterium]